MNYYYSITFLLIATLRLTKTEPNVCGCLLYVFKDGASNAFVTEVLSFVIPDFAEQSDECNDETTNKCNSVCTERIGYLTHNMDLEKQPKADLNISGSFGQFVCDKFGYDIEDESLGVFSYNHCNQTNSVHGVNQIKEHSQTVFTGLVAQQSISCKNKKFMVKSGESSTKVTSKPTVPTRAVPTTKAAVTHH